jgi:hypothetical protein
MLRTTKYFVKINSVVCVPHIATGTRIQCLTSQLNHVIQKDKGDEVVGNTLNLKCSTKHHNFKSLQQNNPLRSHLRHSDHRQVTVKLKLI